MSFEDYVNKYITINLDNMNPIQQSIAIMKEAHNYEDIDRKRLALFAYYALNAGISNKLTSKVLEEKIRFWNLYTPKELSINLKTLTFEEVVRISENLDNLYYYLKLIDFYLPENFGSLELVEKLEILTKIQSNQNISAFLSLYYGCKLLSRTKDSRFKKILENGVKDWNQIKGNEKLTMKILEEMSFTEVVEFCLKMKSIEIG